MVQIAVLDDYQDVAMHLADWSGVQARGQVTVFHDTIADEAELVARLKPFEIICAMRERTPLRKALIDQLPNLKCIITTGARNASIDVAAASARGITVCGTPGMAHPTVELTWALILALSRRIPHEDHNMREGGWQRMLGTDLNGKVLGVLGLGPRERAAEIGVGYVGTKESLVTLADVLTVHVVLSDRSRGMIGAKEIAAMKPTAYLINTSRGPIVDEAAMVAALRSQSIGGAGLDVYDQEPLPEDHPLRGLANTVLSPHQGYVSAENYAVFYGGVVEDILAFLDGKPIRVIAAK